MVLPLLGPEIFGPSYYQLTGGDAAKEAILLKFIMEFVVLYLNREITETDYRVWCNYLTDKMFDLEDMLFKASAEYDKLLTAAASLVDTREGRNTRHDTSSGKTTNSGSNTSSGQLDTTGTDKRRSVSSDYPQANINESGLPLEAFNYKYASGADDGYGNTESKTVTSNQAATESETGTSGESDGETNFLETYTRQGISDFDRVKSILEYLGNNPYSPIRKAVRKCGSIFMPQYVQDDERKGYIRNPANIITGF